MFNTNQTESSKMSCCESLPKSCFSKICRTCLINTNLFLIHEVTREGINLMDILKDWTFLEVENGEFPKQMCNHCINSMYRTYHFLKKCHQSQIILKSIVSQESLKNDVHIIMRETNEEISNDTVYSGESNINADSQIDDSFEIKSDISSNEDQNDYIPPSDNIISKIQSVKKNDVHIIMRETNEEISNDIVLSGESSVDNTFNESMDNNFIENDDSDSQTDDSLEIKSDISSNEDQNDSIPPSDNIISKIQSVKKNDVRIIMRETNEEISNDIVLSGESSVDNTFNESMDNNFIENDDSDSLTDDSLETKSDISNNEDQNDYIPQNDNIINKIQSVENQISKIKVKNRLRLQETVKNQLVGYTGNLPKQNKRAYVIQKGPPFTCITCDSSYQTYEDLKKHKIETKHTRNLKFKCQYCQKKYYSFCKYEEHVRTHTGEKPNRCPTCGKCFNFKTILKRHMLVHMGIKPYRCQFCKKDFTRRQYLMDHERIHTGERLLCSFCGKGFTSYSTLSSHEKIHKGHTPTVRIRNPMSEDQVFQCNFCDKVLSNDLTLKAHLLLHGPKNFSCEICGKTYVTNRRLQNHIQLTHQGYKYCCHVCGKKYKQKSTLTSHMKTHTGPINYSCEICGKNFGFKASLNQHMRIHTGDTKYQCKECLQICINKWNLENHMRIHTGEKPFVCAYCGKHFAQEVNMKAHAKIHTGEKNHICGLCSKAFYNTRSLKKHMAIHTKNADSGNDLNK